MVSAVNIDGRIALDKICCDSLPLYNKRCLDDYGFIRCPSCQHFLCFFGQHQFSFLWVEGAFFFTIRLKQHLFRSKSFLSSLRPPDCIFSFFPLFESLSQPPILSGHSMYLYYNVDPVVRRELSLMISEISRLPP